MYKETLMLSTLGEDGKANILVGAQALKEGKLVVFPTETVYGIGANIELEDSVKAIFTAKGRPQDNPLIVHVSSEKQARKLVSSFPPTAEKLAKHFWPGALTLVLPKAENVSAIVSGGLDSIGVRMPSNPVALKLLQLANVPIAAPSANTSGKPSPTTAQHCFSDLAGKVDIILDGGKTEIGLESTVLSLIGEVPVLLRPGGVTAQQIEAVVGKIEISGSILNQQENPESLRSPGIKYKHYAPKANTVLVIGSKERYVQFCNQYEEENLWAMAFAEDLEGLAVPAISYGKTADIKEQGEKIFQVLRELDEKDPAAILIHAPQKEGLGLAVYNRLLRASSFQEVYL